MVVRLSEVSYVGPVSTTTSTFLSADRDKVEGQPGAKGRSALIEFNDPVESGSFHGIVGVNDAGHRMLADDNFVAKPCPPFCPIKVGARAVSYP
jgi:hypothetical protein